MRAYNLAVACLLLRNALCLALAALICACHKANTSQLPRDWPLKKLGLPPESTVFEGHVKDNVPLGENATATQWTVFFTSATGWEDSRASVERELRALGFLHQKQEPSATPMGAQGMAFSSAYASGDGKYLVVLVYEESAESQQSLGRGYYTLMLQVNKPPLAPGEDFAPL
jgi:hypothetical protein